jgi:hypothetical protein
MLTTTMKARLLDTAAAEWTALLRDTPHDFYHLPAYAALSAAHEGGEAMAVLVESGARRLLLPFVLREIPGSRHDAASPYGYAGPIVRARDDAPFLSQALGAAVSALRDAGVVSLFVRFHPLLDTVTPDGVGEVVLHGDTVSIDLTLPTTVLWSQMRHNHQRDIRKAVKNGFTARMDPEFGHYDAFKRLYRATMDRRSATAYYYFDDAYFDGLRDALGGRLHLCIVEGAGEVAAAGLFVETGGIVQYHLGGSDERLARNEPSKLMVSFATGWAKTRGNRRLHLGGGVGGANDSLLYFKSGFSPDRHPFRTLRVVIDRPEYDRLVRLKDPGLEPRDLTGFFPAYRSEQGRFAGTTPVAVPPRT